VSTVKNKKNNQLSKLLKTKGGEGEKKDFTSTKKNSKEMRGNN